MKRMVIMLALIAATGITGLASNSWPKPAAEKYPATTPTFPVYPQGEPSWPINPA